MLPPDFIEHLEYVPTEQLLTLVKNKKPWHGGTIVELVNEVRPSDLFCYLGARFGPPNGIMNLLRSDDSDNLIHWEWTLQCDAGFVSIQGHNFRTELHIPADLKWVESDRESLVRQFLESFKDHGPQMGTVRKRLEPWVEFVNPYQRIRRSVNRLLKELDSLQLEPKDIKDPLALATESERGLAIDEWEAAAARFSKGFGLCFGIRAMLPVLAESFVNLVLHVLMRPEVKSDTRLREHVIRAPIDVRVRGLRVQCVGFVRNPDYSHEACGNYHSLVNGRNDLLHGNLVIEKLKFNELFFLGKVPVFKEYRSAWQRSLGVELESVGLKEVRNELRVVDEFIEYIMSCMREDVRQSFEPALASFELGMNKKTQRFGVLFPGHLVDFRMGPRKAEP